MVDAETINYACHKVLFWQGRDAILTQTRDWTNVDLRVPESHDGLNRVDGGYDASSLYLKALSLFQLDLTLVTNFRKLQS